MTAHVSPEVGKLKVSIALCTYNGEPFLQEQLDSIANQTRLPDEVVIGDDASTDKTLEILERWRDSMPFRVKIITRKKNLGFRKNFETTAKECDGDVLFFCDQDDIWFPEKIEKVMMIFESSSEVDLIGHNTVVVDKNRQNLGLTEITLRSPKNKNLSMSMRFFCPVNNSFPITSGCCLVVRIDFMKKCLPFFSTHDTSLYLLARVGSKFVTIFEPLMYYRFHGQNFSLATSWEKECERVAELEKNCYRLDVSRFWGHYSEIMTFLEKIKEFPDTREKRKIIRFTKFTISHMTNRSRIQRNAVLFAPLFLYELVTFRYFRRDQPIRSMFYDLKCGLFGKKEKE